METNTVFLTDGVGYQQHKRGGIATFSIEGAVSDLDKERLSGFQQTYKALISEHQTMLVGKYAVPLWGDKHNLYPQEVDALISENKLLPSILTKQADYLYGKGPYLYMETEEDGKLKRVPALAPEVYDWLERWEEEGLADYRDYLRALIQDYYRVRTCVSRYHFSIARRNPQTQTGSIRGLSYVGADEARLAIEADKVQLLHGNPVQNRDCHFVAVGDWLTPRDGDICIFSRFDPQNPYQSATSISFNAEQTFGRRVYAYNDWLNGLREWVRASNLTPKYLNSYLKNALNAHIHAQIPAAWCEAQAKNLQELIRQNMNETDPNRRVKEYRGVKLIDPETKKPYRYSVAMMEDLIASELEKVTRMLAGEGKNQGKLYATTKLGQEGWEFKDFPGKFKEYFESVISYDKRADQVTLAGLSINSSITNVDADGQISKSGSDVYYNYMVYLNTLSYAEQFVTKDINRAIRLNFPARYREGVRLGFRLEVPMRQQEVSPKDRLENA